MSHSNEIELIESLIKYAENQDHQTATVNVSELRNFKEALEVTGSDQIVAYEMEVSGPLSNEWTTHYYSIDEVPENPEEAWRDDHDIRNVRPLTYLDESSEEDEDEGGFRFVTCEECKKKLPVGVSWDTEIKCANCGNVQSLGDS